MSDCEKPYLPLAKDQTFRGLTLEDRQTSPACSEAMSMAFLPKSKPWWEKLGYGLVSQPPATLIARFISHGRHSEPYVETMQTMTELSAVLLILMITLLPCSQPKERLNNRLILHPALQTINVPA